MSPLPSAAFWPAVNLFVRSIPAHLMAYYPFRDRLRFPLWSVLLPVCLLQLGQSVLYGFAVQAGSSGRMVEYGFAFAYMAIYFFAVRDDRFKILFLYLFVMDYEMILRGLSAFLEARLFYSPDMDFLSPVSTGITLVLLLVTAPPMLCFLDRARERVLRTDAPMFWRTVWLVPAFTTAIVMIFTSDFTPETVRSFRFLLSRVLLLLCIFVVYSILLDAVDGIRRQAALMEQAASQEQMLNLLRMQQGQLARHMEETKAARHDLRQHLRVLRSYLEKEDLKGIRSYLDSYETQLPADTHRTFSRNFSLNAVFTYYAAEAKNAGIAFDVKTDFPETLPVSEPEACAILGNLLENAVNACKNLTETAPFIRVRGTCGENHFVLTVDNTCEKEPVYEDGRFLSSVHEGYGTGTWSVKTIAERNGGTAEFSYSDGVFLASVLLYG